jgi:hypothetical protein
MFHIDLAYIFFILSLALGVPSLFSIWRGEKAAAEEAVIPAILGDLSPNFRPLSQWKTRPDQKLIENYQVLFGAFHTYYQDTFGAEPQPETDPEAFTFDTKVRYGLLCSTEGLPIPPDCAYGKLRDRMYEEMNLGRNSAES